MKKQFFRFTLSAIIICLTGGALNPAVAATQPSWGDGTHYCGVTDDQWNKRYSDQFPNRRYRTAAANLDGGEPRTVRMIYFLPNDWPYRADVVQQMKDDMRTIQTFYTEQMEAHGYGKVTFRFETDPQGEPMVHRVDGKHPFSHYDNTLGTAVSYELQETYDLNANIYFIVLGTDALRQGDGQPASAVGNRFTKNGGWALAPNEFSWGLVAHELGHTFGLNHDFRDGAYIMSYRGRASIGPAWSQLSACAAEFLSVHPYFNPGTPIEEAEPPTIELISPRRYPPGSTSVPVRVQVSDSEGLHQVLLHAFGALQVCRRLTGEKDAVVEFDYDGGFGIRGFESFSSAVTHGIRVDIVDTDGNVSDTFFTLAETSPHHIATLPGHTDWVSSVAFSPDERTLASGSYDGIKLWDVATQQNIATLGANWVYSVSFSPDGRALASGLGSGAVNLWDVATQQNIATLEGHTGAVNSVAFSPDGTTLASGSWDGTVKLWDVATRQNIATFEEHTDWVNSVSFSSDGAILATGSRDRTVKLWDMATHRDIGTFEDHTAEVYSVSFSPVDATLLATGSWDTTVKLWDVATQQNIATFEGHTGGVNSVSFSRDGTILASGSRDRTVKLWDMATGVSFATLRHTSRVNSVSFSSDGATLASGTRDGTVELWDTSGLMGVRLEAVVEIDIPDPNLRAAIAEAIGLPLSASIVRGHLENLTHFEARNADISDLAGLEDATNLRGLDLGREYVEAEDRWVNSNSVSDFSPLTGLTKLRWLSLEENSMSDISSVAGLTNLTRLNLGGNSVSDISSVAGLTRLTWLHLWGNSVSDISPLVANTGLGNGDTVYVNGNPLSYQSIHTHIPTLQSRGVTVVFDNQAHPALLKISGDNQKGASFASLPNPLVVEAQDANGSALAGVSVTFAVTAGGGTLSIQTTTTDANGRAQTTLTLGSNLGTNTVEISATGIAGLATFHAIADTESLPIPADVNGDGSVNILDLVSVASEFGNEGTNLAADVSGDGVVNILDLILVAGMFEDAAAAPSTQPQVPETLTAVEVQQWLTDAVSLEARSPIMKRGIMLLGQLLVSLTPRETVLLANYPNPFNPETWIPYRLAEDAFVTLVIYDLSGHVVRTLDIGHRIAAVYEGRSKAVYWDGRNSVGESVASGVYFYTLTAGDFSATRKMVILK